MNINDSVYVKLMSIFLIVLVLSAIYPDLLRRVSLFYKYSIFLLCFYIYTLLKKYITSVVFFILKLIYFYLNKIYKVYISTSIIYRAFKRSYYIYYIPFLLNRIIEPIVEFFIKFERVTGINVIYVIISLVVLVLISLGIATLTYFEIIIDVVEAKKILDAEFTGPTGKYSPDNPHNFFDEMDRFKAIYGEKFLAP